MRKKLQRLLFLFAFVLFFAALTFFTGQAMANEEDPEKEKDKTKSIGLTVYVQGGYTYNFNKPGNGENDFRVFDTKANQITADMLQVIIEKETKPGQLGFKLNAAAGDIAKSIHSYGLGDNPDNSFDLTEAYVQYNVPLGKGLKISVGKFLTCHGGEVIEAIDNPNYSRSFLFGYAIPFTHTGLKANYDFTDQVGATVYVVNGWDNFKDNNDAKTLGLSLGINPSEQVGMTFNVMNGPEQDDNTSNNRFLFDWVGTVKPGEKWLLLLNYDYGSEKDVPGLGDAQWSGFAGIIQYEFTKNISMAVRGEVFKDRDGFRTGIKQTLQEFTISPQWKLDNGIVIRPEYRVDLSNKKAFDGGAKKDQSTFGIGVMYRHEW